MSDMPSPQEIDAATTCAEGYMFSPHELPLSADLHTQYRMMAEQMLIVAEHERWKRSKRARIG